ncbi:non-ribosomal peptide synthetase [Streptomyces bacillaris]|uniref:non-ribosomal peptide synthetase n=1 Tax=Streptomyces bacillaris TaxID=68179 RepID=UPI0038012C71
MTTPFPSRPLTPAQHGLWVTEQVLAPGAAHHLALTVRFPDPPDPEALAARCARLLERQPVLRSRVDPDGPALTPATGPALTPATGPALAPATGPAPELRHLACAADELDALLAEESARPFDLAEGPLVRFALVTAGGGLPVLHVVVHHLVFDGASKDVLLAEISGVGTEPGHSDGQVGADEPDGQAIALAREFWSERWHEPAPPVLPGLTSSVRDATAPAPGGAVPFALGPALDARLTETAGVLGVTRFELLLALWHTLLFRYGNQAPVTALELSTRLPGSPGCIGLYVNELPVFTHPDPDRPFSDYAREVRAELREVYAHRPVPLGRAVGGLTPRTAIAPLSVSYRRRTGWEAEEAPGVTVDWIGFTHAVRNLAHLQLVDGPDGLTGSFQYRSDAFDPGAPARIVGHFRTLLDAVLTAPGATEAALAGLPLLAGDELAAALNTGNDLLAACPDGATVVSMFAARVAEDPDAVAVVTADDTELSYGELQARVHAFADRLTAAGLGAGDLVGVQVGRSVGELVAVLGVLTAGAAYVPLDPGYPAERLEFVRSDAGLAALVVEGPAPEGLPAGLTVLAPDTGEGPVPAPASGGVRASGPAAGDPAYVIYTSGSTGRPKGVEIPHRALANLLATMGDHIEAGPRDRWLGLTSLSFDISTVELLLPLTTGARVVLVPEGQQRDGGALVKLIDAHGITHVQATPSSWRLMLAAGLHHPELVAVAGGEALPEPLAEELGAVCGRLVNVYGPTETTVWSTLAHLTTGAPVTIGRPLAATRAYVLDERGTPVPDFVPGELHLGGAGVAHGYRGRPGLTAQRFVPDPWGPPGSRLYRTGDLVRRLPDGRLEFAGRLDSQVKLRGHRIELGEIEARIVEDARVSQAVVVLDGGGGGGAGGAGDVAGADAGADARLVAYVVGVGAGAGVGAGPGVGAGTGEVPAAEELRERLARTLPAAMVPAVWVPLPALPLTPNGKVDRARLPEPPRLRPDAPEPLAATGATVATGVTTAGDGVDSVVREIWQEVLRLDDIGPDEDLFDLGGHSLTITSIAARIRKRLGVEVPLDVFFDTPTLAGVSDAVSGLQQTASSEEERDE